MSSKQELELKYPRKVDLFKVFGGDWPIFSDLSDSLKIYLSLLPVTIVAALIMSLTSYVSEIADLDELSINFLFATFDAFLFLLVGRRIIAHLRSEEFNLRTLVDTNLNLLPKVALSYFCLSMLLVYSLSSFLMIPFMIIFPVLIVWAPFFVVGEKCLSEKSIRTEKEHARIEDLAIDSPDSGSMKIYFFHHTSFFDIGFIRSMILSSTSIMLTLIAAGLFWLVSVFPQALVIFLDIPNESAKGSLLFGISSAFSTVLAYTISFKYFFRSLPADAQKELEMNVGSSTLTSIDSSSSNFKLIFKSAFIATFIYLTAMILSGVLAFNFIKQFIPPKTILVNEAKAIIEGDNLVLTFKIKDKEEKLAWINPNLFRISSKELLPLSKKEDLSFDDIMARAKLVQETESDREQGPKEVLSTNRIFAFDGDKQLDFGSKLNYDELKFVMYIKKDDFKGLEDKVYLNYLNIDEGYSTLIQFLVQK